MKKADRLDKRTVKVTWSPDSMGLLVEDGYKRSICRSIHASRSNGGLGGERQCVFELFPSSL